MSETSPTIPVAGSDPQSFSSLQPQEAVVPTEQDGDVTSQLLAATIELRERLLAFVGAVAEITDCGPDVEAIKRADAAIARATGK